jgi:hypothetical protein
LESLEDDNADNNNNSKLIISSKKAACQGCEDLLRETVFAVEMSSVGHHTSGFLRFSNAEGEEIYEKHMREVHGMEK